MATNLEVDGIDGLAALVRATRQPLIDTYQQYRNSSELGDNQLIELEDAFRDWMNAWSNECGYAAALVMSVAKELEGLSETLMSIDSDVGVLFDAHLD